jgi:hypothetical protein
MMVTMSLVVLHPAPAALALLDTTAPEARRDTRKDTSRRWAPWGPLSSRGDTATGSGRR